MLGRNLILGMNLSLDTMSMLLRICSEGGKHQNKSLGEFKNLYTHPLVYLKDSILLIRILMGISFKICSAQCILPWKLDRYLMKISSPLLWLVKKLSRKWVFLMNVFILEILSTVKNSFILCAELGSKLEFPLWFTQLNHCTSVLWGILKTQCLQMNVKVWYSKPPEESTLIITVCFYMKALN